MLGNTALGTTSLAFSLYIYSSIKHSLLSTSLQHCVHSYPWFLVFVVEAEMYPQQNPKNACIFNFCIISQAKATHTSLRCTLEPISFHATFPNHVNFRAVVSNQIGQQGPFYVAHILQGWLPIHLILPGTRRHC